MAIGKRNEWRYSLNQPKLCMIDARSVIFLLFAGMDIHYWTVGVAALVIFALYWVEKMKRMSLNSALRLVIALMTNMIVGKQRSPDKMRRRHFFIDYEASRGRLDLSMRDAKKYGEDLQTAVARINERVQNSEN